jgi:hypothetical protein
VTQQGGLAVTHIPFRLRGVEGTVTVEYGVNDDPERWGYLDLKLDWYSPDAVRGFPVMQASVHHPSEGYAADVGWIQVVRYTVRDPGAERRRRCSCGFTWGYDVKSGVREVEALEIAEYTEWLTNLPALRGRYPDWDFQDSPWDRSGQWKGGR